MIPPSLLWWWRDFVQSLQRLSNRERQNYGLWEGKRKDRKQLKERRYGETFGQQRTRLHVSFVFVLGTGLLALTGAACTNLGDIVEANSTDNNVGDGSSDDSNNGEGNGETQLAEKVDLAAILAGLAENVILPVYQEFQSAALIFKTASNDYATAVANDSTDVEEKLAALEEAWRIAMAAWQQAEMLQVGPAGNSSKVVAGDNIRDEIYSWPTVNSCRVDQELVEEVYDSSSFFSDELVNVYGLDAVEYLIFSQSADNTCPSVVHLNTSGSWSAMSESDLKFGRASYNKALANNIVNRANELVNYWSASDGNMVGDLANAGSSGSIYETQLQALNDIFAAMFFLDTTVKDKKLAIPAGLDSSCDGVCPEKAESQWADVSKENIVGNLKAFQRTFHGGSNPEEDIGFDDFLVELDYQELAQTMTNDIVAAINATEAINGSLKDALSRDHDSVKAAYDAVKKVTDNLKGEFVTILGLTIPAEGAGDSD